MLIDECIGIGEIAIADHRGSQLSWQELARVASEARVGGMCAAKAGIVMVHVGSDDDKLNTLFDVATHTAIPLAQFYPTHMNRNIELLNEGIRFAKSGGTIDFTASNTPEILADGEVKCATALRMALEQGVDADQITFSTDGHASLPHFNEQGELKSLKVGAMTSMLKELTDAVLEEKVELSIALKTVTENPARILQLTQKGKLQQGYDADLLLLEADTLCLHSVMAKGSWFMQDSSIVRKGLFES